MSQANEALNNDTSNQTDLCVPTPSYFILWFNLVPVLEILTNVFVIVAALRSRRNLRHNYVYVYVINTLVANSCFGLAYAYEITNRVLNLERIWNSPFPFRINNSDSNPIKLQVWWAFRTSFSLSLFLVMSGSIMALIYGIRESSYFVGRRLRHHSSEKSLKMRTSHRRTKMIIIIVLNWMLPLLCSVGATAGWNCVQNCFCVSGSYDPNLYYCQTDKYRHCSRYMLPLTNSFVILIIIAWMVESVGIVYMLVTLIAKYLNITRANKQQPSNRNVAALPSTETNRGETHMEANNDMNLQSRYSIDNMDEASPKNFCFHFPSLNYHIKLLLVISILYVILTFPSMLLGIVDIASKEYVLSFYAVFFSNLLCAVYSFLAPLALVHYMPGLRLAFRRIFVSCKCCTKTTITTSTSVSSTTDL